MSVSPGATWASIGGKVAQNSTIFGGGPWDRADTFAAAGLAITVVGLGFAIQQIRKTLSATQATEASVRATLGKLARDEMLGLIAALERVERDLRSAVDSGQPPTMVGDRLADWRTHAYGLWELIHRGPKVKPHVHDDLLESAKVAAELLTKLPTDVTKMQSSTKTMRGLTSRVCGQLATLDRQLRYDTGKDDAGA